jgi:hypothetical protein
MKFISIWTLVALCTSSIVEAHAEPLGLGNVYTGMSPDKVIKNPKAQCRLKGMIYKYKVCKQIEEIENMPIQAEYYFDENILEMASFIFEKRYIENILIILDRKYGKAINKAIDGNSVRWTLPEGEIVLSLMDTQPHLVEVKIFDQKGIEKYKERIKNYYIKDLNAVK